MTTIDRSPDVAEAAADVRLSAVRSRDRRFDGVFFVGITSTGIYCRPSCPAGPAGERHITYHRSAAAAQTAGFRACKRCRPDAVPGSPDWDVAADTAGRTMRLIHDGVVEREGVEGLASRVGYSSRQLHRLLVQEVGAGPLALARARRAQQARILVETTALPLSDVAFAAGFSSIRQFNDTVREVYATTPTDLRARASRGRAVTRPGEVRLRLAVRAPFHAAELHRFLAAHLVEGVESAGEDWYARTLRLPHGTATVRLQLPATEPADTTYVEAVLRPTDLRDLGVAVERCRRLIGADADPVAVDGALGEDTLLAPLVAARPGLRVPGAADGEEIALRTVLGQQVSLAGANRLQSRLTEQYGDCAPHPADGNGRLFPTAERLAEVDPTVLPMPRARAAALVGLAAALAAGEVPLDRSAPREEVRRRLLALPGIGPWTADYVAIRALGDPDVFLSGDVAVRRVLAAHGSPVDSRGAEALAERWRPWRSSALIHLWSTLDLRPAGRPTTERH